MVVAHRGAKFSLGQAGGVALEEHLSGIPVPPSQHLQVHVTEQRTQDAGELILNAFGLHTLDISYQPKTRNIISNFAALTVRKQLRRLLTNQKQKIIKVLCNRIKTHFNCTVQDSVHDGERGQ